MRFSARNNTLSIGKEATWGAGGSTTALVPNTKDTNTIEEEFVESSTLTGSRANYGSILVARKGKGSIPFELNLETIGYILKGIFGNEVVSGAGPYTHTFSMLNSTQLPSWVLQSGKGGYQVMKLLGAVFDSLAIEISQKAIVTGSADFQFKDWVNQALALVPANIAIATDIITVTQTWAINDIVRFYPTDGVSTLPAPLVEGTDYFVSSPTGTTIKVAATSGGTAIDITSIGTGTFEVVKLETLASPTNRILTFKDSNAATAVKVNATNFGELLSASLAFANNLSTDDFRLGGAGALASITAGKFDATGKLTVNFNGPSKILRDKMDLNVPVSLQLELWEDAQYGIRFLFPAVYLKGGDLSLDFVGTGSLSVSPVTVTLINAHSGAY